VTVGNTLFGMTIAQAQIGPGCDAQQWWMPDPDWPEGPGFTSQGKTCPSARFSSPSSYAQTKTVYPAGFRAISLGVSIRWYGSNGFESGCRPGSGPGHDPFYELKDQKTKSCRNCTSQGTNLHGGCDCGGSAFMCGGWNFYVTKHVSRTPRIGMDMGAYTSRSESSSGVTQTGCMSCPCWFNNTGNCGWSCNNPQPPCGNGSGCMWPAQCLPLFP
jgi:hypothetical protein